MLSTALEKVISDELKSGLKITLVDEGGELYARVSWISWDSGFRDSGLEVEDRIIGIDGAPLTLPEDPKERRIARDRVVGGLSESKVFAELGFKDGSPLTLTVLRRQVPGRGWTRLLITGAVRAERIYYTADGKPALAPGGPERTGRNEVGEAWTSWLERRVFDWERMLDGRWLGKFNSRVELQIISSSSRVSIMRSQPIPGSFRSAWPRTGSAWPDPYAAARSSCPPMRSRFASRGTSSKRKPRSRATRPGPTSSPRTVRWMPCRSSISCATTARRSGVKSSRCQAARGAQGEGRRPRRRGATTDRGRRGSCA